MSSRWVTHIESASINDMLTRRQYIRDLFAAAKDSMSINGMDSRELDAELAKAQDGEGRNASL